MTFTITGTSDMSQLTELWTNRKDFRITQIVNDSLPTAGEGEVLVAIDKFENHYLLASSQSLPTLL